MSKHELTARIAYEIYVQRGRSPGRSREDWAAAETVVALCLAFAAALSAAAPQESAEPSPAQAEPPAESGLPAEPREPAARARRLKDAPPIEPVFSAEERAFALLLTAVNDLGRAEVAKTLGYKSTSSVGPYLRGQRSVGAKLAERILANLAPAPRPAERRRAA